MRSEDGDPEASPSSGSAVCCLIRRRSGVGVASRVIYSTRDTAGLPQRILPVVMGEETDLRTLLATLHPKARDQPLPRLIRDQADRDAISSRLMPYRDQNGQDWADILDFLTMWPDAGRHVVRTLGELTAEIDPKTVRTPKPRRSVLSLFLSPRKHRSKGICAGRARLTRSRVRR